MPRFRITFDPIKDRATVEAASDGTPDLRIYSRGDHTANYFVICKDRDEALWIAEEMRRAMAYGISFRDRQVGNITDLDLGRVGFEVYAAATDGQRLTENFKLPSLPRYGDLPPLLQSAWSKAAAAILVAASPEKATDAA